MYMTTENTSPRFSDLRTDDAEITPAMIEAGEFRFGELLQAEVSSSYLVEEVFRAMVIAQLRSL
jgi:hypothetical protein